MNQLYYYHFILKKGVVEKAKESGVTSDFADFSFIFSD